MTAPERIRELGALLEQARDADAPLGSRHAAFAELVRRFQDMAFGYALSVLGAEEPARDAAQEAFIAAWCSLHQVRRPAAFPGWFRRVVHTQCMRFLRASPRDTRPLEALEAQDGASRGSARDEPFAAAAGAELRARLHGALEQLPPLERPVATLFLVAGLPQREIAATLELPLTTVQKRLHTARRRLREQLADVLPERTETRMKDDLHAARPSRDEHFEATVRLFQAVELGDEAEAAALLARYPWLATATRRGQFGRRTALHLAAERGHTAIAALLLAHGADVAARDEGDNATPLHWAAGGGHLETVRLLLERGAPVDVRDDVHERGPLGWATALGDTHREVAALLIRHGAPVDIFVALALGDTGAVRRLAEEDSAVLQAPMSVCEDFAQPLHLAVKRNDAEMLTLLLELGAPINAKTAGGRTPLCVSVEEGREALRDVLLQHGALVDLPAAIAMRDGDRIREHLTGGVPPEELGSALLLAARFGPPELAAQLLDVGAPREFRGCDDWLRGVTPLAVSAYRNQTEIGLLLLERGADPAPVDEYPGATPLHYAAWEGNTVLAAALLDRGAPMDLPDRQFDADPFGWAIENRQQALCDLFMERGAEIGAARAAYLGRLDLVRRLVEADVTALEQPDRFGTPLHQAVLHGFTEIVEYLLKRGADTRARNRNGETPLRMVRRAMHASRSPGGHPPHAAIERLLVEAGAQE